MAEPTSHRQLLAERFEEHRARLEALAYRMLGSLTEAEDAVQETWLRLSEAEPGTVENLGGWLTTVASRVCLNVLRSRSARRSETLDVHVPDPVVRPADDAGPEAEAVLADSVGLALLVVLETLTPAERLALVLHDMFDVPFEQIAPVLDRTPVAARQLASRARRRVAGADGPPGRDVRAQQHVVDAFFAAARDGEFEALVGVLAPDVVLRIDGGAALANGSMLVRGAPEVARQTGRGLRSILGRPGVEVRACVVNGGAGVVVLVDGEAAAVMGFTVTGGRIGEINSIADPARVGPLAAAAFGTP